MRWPCLVVYIVFEFYWKKGTKGGGYNGMLEGGEGGARLDRGNERTQKKKGEKGMIGARGETYPIRFCCLR